MVARAGHATAARGLSLLTLRVLVTLLAMHGAPTIQWPIITLFPVYAINSA